MKKLIFRINYKHWCRLDTKINNLKDPGIGDIVAYHKFSVKCDRIHYKMSILERRLGWEKPY